MRLRHWREQGRHMPTCSPLAPNRQPRLPGQPPCPRLPGFHLPGSPLPGPASTWPAASPQCAPTPSPRSWQPRSAAGGGASMQAGRMASSAAVRPLRRRRQRPQRHTRGRGPVVCAAVQPAAQSYVRPSRLAGLLQGPGPFQPQLPMHSRPPCRGTRSLTVAVESGSQRVRDIVNKKLATEEIVACAQHAQARQSWGVTVDAFGRPPCPSGVPAWDLLAGWLPDEGCCAHHPPRPLCTGGCASRLAPRTPAASMIPPLVLPRSLQEGGLEGLKLYGMVGVPGETEDGASLALPALCLACRDARSAAPAMRSVRKSPSLQVCLPIGTASWSAC